MRPGRRGGKIKCNAGVSPAPITFPMQARCLHHNGFNRLVVPWRIERRSEYANNLGISCHAPLSGLLANGGKTRGGLRFGAGGPAGNVNAAPGGLLKITAAPDAIGSQPRMCANAKCRPTTRTKCNRIFLALSGSGGIIPLVGGLPASIHFCSIRCVSWLNASRAEGNVPSREAGAGSRATLCKERRTW